ncbi:MAG: division plane positioning ATPase MipZ [Pseudomonadota bacterium]
MSAAPNSAKVIVFGNEKGGSGKTTCALHVAVALLRAGYKVATVDIDSPQCSFTRAFENRATWSAEHGLELPMPDHATIDRGTDPAVAAREEQEYKAFANVVNKVEYTHDFVIVDTPGHDTPLVRLVHAMADTLVTPINDSFIDLDLLATGDLAIGMPIVPSHYSKIVDQARHQRRHVDGGAVDWIVVQNRLSMIQSRNKIRVREMLDYLAPRLGFRIARGISERVIYREFFPIGITVLDSVPGDLIEMRPSVSHIAAREEVRRLIGAMGLNRLTSQVPEPALRAERDETAEPAPVAKKRGFFGFGSSREAAT